MYSFSVAAVISYHKFNSLKQHTFILLQLGRSEVGVGGKGHNQGVGEGHKPSGGSAGGLSLAFSAAGGSCIPGLEPLSISEPAV